LQLEYRRRPSVLGYMLRALASSKDTGRALRFPPIRVSWGPMRIDRAHLDEFLRQTGLTADLGPPILYPHVFGFPTLMTALTHPSFPVPIWGALQIRNHLVLHRPIPLHTRLDLKTRIAGRRCVAKGVEVDLHTTLRAGFDLVWESLVTFFFRGRFGEADAASALSRAPDAGPTVTARWVTPSGEGRRFASLTGDYNGIHYWSWYARRRGFPRPLHHPQLVAGQCMARLRAPPPVRAQRLDLWLKGPVFYGSSVALRTTDHSAGVAFSLTMDAQDRPALVGMWQQVPSGSTLLDPGDEPCDRPLLPGPQ